MLGRIGVTFHQLHSRSDFYAKLAKGQYLGGTLVIRVTHIDLASQSAVGPGASVKILKVVDQPLFSVYTSSFMINSKLPRHMLLPTVIHELAHIVGVGHMGLNFNTQRPLCNENPPNGLTDHQQRKITVLMQKNKCVVPFYEKAGHTSIMLCAFHSAYKGALNEIPRGDALHIKQQFDLMTGLRKNKKKKSTQKNKKSKKQKVSFRTHDLVEYCPYSNVSRCLLLQGNEPFITNSVYQGLRLFDSINRSSGLLVSRESADNLLSFLESLSVFSIMLMMTFLMRLSIKVKVFGLKSDKSIGRHKSSHSSHSMQKNGL